MKLKYELLLILLVLVLSLFGVMTIISSQSEALHPFQLAARQTAWLVTGVALLLALRRVPFQFFRKNCWLIGGLFFVPLILLFFFGVRLNGMRGWFRFGELNCQPTELAKAIFILTLLPILTAPNWAPGKKFLLGLGLTLLWIAPILAQPDFGTGCIYFLIFAGCYFVSGGRKRYLFLTASAGIAAGYWFIISHPYALRRLSGFFLPELDPLGSGWHSRQFEAAIARGHFFGSKMGQAVWSNAYLPLPYNDSAFATLTETTGLFGNLLIMALFVGIIWTLERLVNRPRLTPEARLFIMGGALLLMTQSLIHVGVNLSLLPPTGLTLPFISYGGSSLLGSFLLIGLLLSASNDLIPESDSTAKPPEESPQRPQN